MAYTEQRTGPQRSLQMSERMSCSKELIEFERTAAVAARQFVKLGTPKSTVRGIIATWKHVGTTATLRSYAEKLLRSDRSR